MCVCVCASCEIGLMQAITKAIISCHLYITQTAEEIEKFLIDEKLSDLDRTCLLLSTGQDVQKLCVIENLPNLLRQHQMETLCRVIPKLCVSC